MLLSVIPCPYLPLFLCRKLTAPLKLISMFFTDRKNEVIKALVVLVYIGKLGSCLMIC